MNDEGALIAFTLLSQMVIGATLVYVFLFFFNTGNIAALSSGFSLKTPELLLLTGLLLAILLSMLHLGKPSNAVHALNNLGSSWISREIFTVTLFSLSLFLLFLSRWLVAGKPILTAAFLFAGFAALLLLVSMSKLYMIPAVSTWNSWLTPAGFALTALTAGLALLLAFSMVFQMEFALTKPLLPVLLVLLLLEIAHGGILYGQLNAIDFIHTNQFISEGIFKPYFIIRIMLSGLAFVFLLFIFYMGQTRFQPTLLTLSLLFIFAGIILGRIAFFAGYVRIGI